MPLESIGAGVRGAYGSGPDSCVSMLSMKGRCVICGAVGKLTDDHVPPRSVAEPTPLEMRRLGATIGTEAFSPYRRGFHAAKFPSLCLGCNSSRLGSRYDPVLSRFAADVRRWISATEKMNLWLGKNIEVETYPALLARSVVGHLLAAEERKDPWEVPQTGSSTDALKTFFL